MDDEGLDVDALEAELDRGGGLLPLQHPDLQNPSGRTLGLERRRRLAALVAERGLDVLEDDPYGAVRYDGEAQPSLHELEGGDRVAFTSSFSKTVAPGLRVAWYVVPDELAAAYDDRAVSTSITPPLLPQAVVHQGCSSAVAGAEFERIRGLLRARRDAMLAALGAEMPDTVTWNEPSGGYFLWVDFGVDAEALQRRAAADVAFVKGADFFPGGDGGAWEARLAFSYEPPGGIGEGVRRLSTVLSG